MATPEYYWKFPSPILYLEEVGQDTQVWSVCRNTLWKICMATISHPR
jgi:hypothetical protein